MKKIYDFFMPLKFVAAGIFTGFIILYMVSGVAYALVTGNSFDYSIPFAFVFQGLILSALVSLLWGLLLGDAVIKKWRYFPRIIVFSLLLMALLGVCYLTFIAMPADWSNFWLITNGVIGLGLIIFSVICELLFKATGRRYTEALRIFQTKI